MKASAWTLTNPAHIIRIDTGKGYREKCLGHTTKLHIIAFGYKWHLNFTTHTHTHTLTRSHTYAHFELIWWNYLPSNNGIHPKVSRRFVLSMPHSHQLLVAISADVPYHDRCYHHHHHHYCRHHHGRPLNFAKSWRLSMEKTLRKNTNRSGGR